MSQLLTRSSVWVAAAIAGSVAITLLRPWAARAAMLPCTHNQVCGLKNAEDFVRVPDSRWAIASRLARDAAAPGGFSLVDLENRTARLLTPDFSGHASAEYAGCPGALMASELITHGLDIRRRPDGASELFAVNHGGRESIEVFAIRPSRDGPQLRWKGCVLLPAEVSGNAVAALPHGLVVTSFGGSGPGGLAELLAGRPSGFVAEWTPHKGWAHVAGSAFGGDNGVAASPDGETLYVNDWNDGTLRVLSLRKGIAPISIRLGGFHPDNLHWLPGGRLLIAGQKGMARDDIACVSHEACAVGSMIVIVDPRSREVTMHWAVPPTSTFAAASTALLYRSDYWASSFRGDRVVRLGRAP
ncbi:MAG TPA: hypothetical protein VIY50_04425 [Steroidobacteraceae bacterium]